MTSGHAMLIQHKELDYTAQGLDYIEQGINYIPKSVDATQRA
jgi:hypothetical protein